MTDLPILLAIGSAFLVYLVIGGVFADGWEARRDARRRNRR